MVRHKEFWFTLVLLALVVPGFYCLYTIDSIGEYWVKILHDYAQKRGVSDKAIYWSKTREFYFTTGSIQAILLAGLGFEVYFLLKRLQGRSNLKQAAWTFVVAVLPIAFLLARALWFLHKQGRFL